MLTFTLDTNGIIDLEQGRRDASAIRQLIDAHSRGVANVAVAGISASEKQRDGSYLKTFHTFQELLDSLGLARIETLYPMFRLDMTFLDRSVWTSPETAAVEEQIQEVLFPNIEDSWQGFRCEV